MNRRTLLGTALLGLVADALPRLAGPAAAEDAGAPFTFDTVVARARDAAQREYVRPQIALAEPFAGLDYDSYRAIRFRDEARLFVGGPGFQMDLMPPGFAYQDRVEINVVSNGVARAIPFSTDLFHFHPNYFPYADGRAPAGLAADHGFSGMRFRHPLNEPGVWDETVVFQGASYFRAVARDTLYGLSARALAIGTGGPAEEFPLFTAFWVEEPQPGARTLTIHALLDGPSVAGAYAFEITPGDETIMAVRSRLFPRVDIPAAGLAPLTSMYFFGPESRRDVDDFRDAVHDSCGLRIVNGAGERIWRPLRNPDALEVSAFADADMRGFGLIQRFRDFEHYQDSEAHYERRPSAWVEPAKPWGPGSVVLVEIPTRDEFLDNIVAFWRPETPLEAGREYTFDYRLVWGVTPIDELPLARVRATRSGASILAPQERVFVIDFDLGRIDPAAVTPVVVSSAGEIRGVSVQRLGKGDVARVGFHLDPAGADAAELRVTLVAEDRIVSEVWLYRWSAAA